MPASTSDLNDITIDDVRRLYCKAEQAIKLIETAIEYSLDVSAINQLRYAGRHIVDALQETPPNEEELRRAARHCQRAIYDCFDIGISFYIADQIKFENDYCLLPEVYSFVDNFEEIITERKNAEKFLREVRSGDKENKADYYEKAEEIFLKLDQSSNKLFLSRSKLNPILQRDIKAEAKEKKEIRMYAVAILLTFIFGVPQFLPKKPSDLEIKTAYTEIIERESEEKLAKAKNNVEAAAGNEDQSGSGATSSTKPHP